MNSYEALNQVVDYIEENLSNQIEYKELAKIVGTSSYTLQRIFCFLTGITLTEYIRKRRLSKAAEELMLSDVKVIDLSTKYQYDSPTAFSSAFKKMHGITPSMLKKRDLKLKNFPKIEFKKTEGLVEELEYRIVHLPKQIFYGKSTGIIEKENKKAIRDLYQTCEKDGTLEKIKQSATGKELYYGVTQYEYEKDFTNHMEYFLLGKLPKEDLEKVELPEATWACFKVDTKNQEDILKLYDCIYMKWLPSSAYREILQHPQLELYYRDYCEICIAVN